MPYTRLVTTGKGASGSSSVTTDAIDTTGADLLVASVHDTVAVTFSDSAGNTWTGLTERTSPHRARLFICVNPTTSATHTFTGAGSVPTICVAGYSGAAASPLDAENSAGVVTGSSLASGSVTPSTNGGLIVVALTLDAARTPSIAGGGLTILQDIQHVGFNHMGGVLADEIQTLLAAREGTWSWTGGDTSGTSVIAAFAPATPPDLGSTPLSWLGGVRMAGGVRVYQAIASGMTPPERPE